MDYFTKFRHQLFNRVLIHLILLQLLIVGGGWALFTSTHTQTLYILAAMSLAAAGGVILSAKLLTRTMSKPLGALWQAIQHVAPHGENQPAPDITHLRVGRELVDNLINNVYQMASVVDSVKETSPLYAQATQDIHANFVANALPLPLLVIDKNDNILYLNETAQQYFGDSAEDAVGKNIYTTLDMSFSDDQTFHSWLSAVRQKSIISNNRWERVRIGLPGQKNTKQFDLAAHYNKDNPLGYETIVVLFDHTEVYSQDDQAMSFVALSVHELRTPLMLLRGYIEVFDEELGPGLNAELQDFMKKMDAAAQQLTAFIDNILNVAKIEDNQLTLQLHEEKWEDVLRVVVNDLRLRAGVRGVTIKANVARDLPTVAVDRYSIYEVIANLLDNAIKYSKDTQEIHLNAALNKEGLVETSIKDFGLGVDASILPHIFDKFYRNHRNRSQIGGTGLGLYISRAIVQAHGGQISVTSKVDQGSTFTFTVQPYSKLAVNEKKGDTDSITRDAHGWIKNHSLYRD